MRKVNERPRSSVVWMGVVFVPITSRARAAQAVVYTDRPYVLVPGGRKVVAVASDQLFRRGWPADPHGCADALLKLGVVTSAEHGDIHELIKKAEEARIKARTIRDLKDALEEVGVAPSSEQERAIREFFPDYKFKP